MTANKYRLVISIAFLVALLYMLSRLELELVYHELAELNKLYLILGVFCLVFSSLIKIGRFTLVSRYYNQKIPFSDAFLIQMVGISIAILTPARLGEGSKAVLLNRRRKVAMTTSASIVIFERFFDMVFLASGAFLFSYFMLDGRITLLIAVFIIALVVFFTGFLKHFNIFKKLIPGRFKKHFTEVTVQTNAGLFVVIAFVTASVWMLEAGLPWFLALSMGDPVAYPLVFGVVCISTITVVLSILPAGVGTVDLSFLVLLPLAGVPAETALSILLIYRFFSIALPYFLAFSILHYKGTTFSEIKSKIEG